MVSYGDWELYVSEIKGKTERGELIPDPDWQRGYIWKLKDEQLLVDSILRGLPIPKFYLTEEYNPKKGVSIHYAVDGQQRLKAIYKFLISKFPIEINGKQYYFKDLDSSTQKKITNYKLNGHYLRDYKQADVNFLFQRLNTTGFKLTNMEVWNNEYYDTNILRMVKEIYEEHKAFYGDIIYTEENAKRMLPLDDIIDLCNCLAKGSVIGGSKKEIETFLSSHRNISTHESSIIKSKFRKTVNNIRELFSKQELEASAYSKRTHFVSLFLSVGLTIPKYYIFSDQERLKKDLLDFIENPPEEYKESVLGAIRQKVKREKRVKFLADVIKRYAVKLDENRFFEESLKQRFWRQYNRVCQICKKKISNYKDATLDHKKPWAKGGKTEENNAQLAHRKCNQKKRDEFEKFIIT